MRKPAIAGLAALAIAADLAAGEFVYRSGACRDAVGRLCGRGRLLALVSGRGIYELDLQREMEADSYAAGFISRDAKGSLDPGKAREVLARLVANEKLRQISKSDMISEAELKRQFDLLQFQFADGKVWTKRLRDSGLSRNFLRREVCANLRVGTWIEHHIASAIIADDESCRRFYAAHHEDFAQPLRLRASHLFLAAPPESPPEVVEAKRNLMNLLVARISHGEQFPQLVWEASEDETTRPLSGDLGYFSSWRIPAEFFAAVSQFQVGEMSKPFRSHLGFHLVYVTDIKPPREMSFEEARAEIVRLLTNRSRALALENLSRQMSSRVELFF